jgi:hypothetical protein
LYIVARKIMVPFFFERSIPGGYGVGAVT